MPTTEQEKAIVGYLDNYCFQNIWNSVHSEYRGNFQLTSVAARLQTATFVFDNSIIGLPGNKAYRVFRFSKSLLSGSFELRDTTDQWYTLVDIAVQYGVKLSVYDLSGHLTPMASTFVFIPTGSDLVFVAIESDALSKSVPDGISTDLYMTVYKNPDGSAAGWQIASIKMTKSTDADTAVGTARAAPKGTGFAVVNGVSYPDLADLPSLSIGDYIDVGVDPTIYTEYVVQIDDNDKGYFSSRYNGYRKVLHCPKDQNPSHQLLTHDGATVFVRDVDTRKAVYFHRVDPVSIKQITHNDLSASYMTLLAFKNALNATRIEVVVRARAHEIERILMTESAWLADLYLCDDDLIIQNLRGESADTLTFWHASELEQSGYVSLMFDNEYSTDPTRLETYIDALGYYAVAAILSTNIYFGSYGGVDLFVQKSFAQRGKKSTALVYDEGVKIHQSLITSTDYDNDHAGISINNQYQLSVGDPLQILLMDQGDPTPTIFIPEDGANTITIPTELYSVYTKLSDTQVSGYASSTSDAYIFTPFGYTTYAASPNADGTTTLIFASPMYGKTVVIPPSRFCWYKSFTLDDDLAATKPIVLPIQTTGSDGTTLPVLGYGNISVYLNGKYLVRDVDYRFDPLYGDTTGGVMLTDLVVCCASFYDPKKTGNVLEIYVSSDRAPTKDVGYVVNNILARTDLLSFWYSQVSAAHAEGVLQTNLLDCATYMITQSPLPNGSLFELRPQYPEVVSELLADYSPVNDERIITAINQYLGRIRPVAGGIITLTTEHKLYSPFITAILSDVVTGKLVIKDDPNEATFLSQFDSYSYLRDRDPTLVNSDIRVDRSYLAIAACYTQPPTMTAVQTRLVQKLIGLTLITSKATLGDTLV